MLFKKNILFFLFLLFAFFTTSLLSDAYCLSLTNIKCYEQKISISQKPLSSKKESVFEIVGILNQSLNLSENNTIDFLNYFNYKRSLISDSLYQFSQYSRSFYSLYLSKITNQVRIPDLIIVFRRLII